MDNFKEPTLNLSGSYSVFSLKFLYIITKKKR